MLSLKMNSQMAKIGIKSTQPILNMETKHPKGKLEIKKPKVKITNKVAKMKIDQTESFAEAGLKSPERMNKEVAQRGRQEMLQGMAKKAQQGNQLANIHKSKGTDMIAEQAIENSFGPYLRDYNITFIPKTPPKTTVQKGEFDIQVEKGDVETKLDKGDISYNFKRGKVDIYLRQRNKLDIQVVEDNSLDLKV